MRSPLNEEKVFRAAAKAQHQTGAAISTHTEVGTLGLGQIQLLMAEGVKPERIIVGHVDRKLDWDYHVALWQTGVTLTRSDQQREVRAGQPARGVHPARREGGFRPTDRLRRRSGAQVLLARLRHRRWAGVDVHFVALHPVAAIRRTERSLRFQDLLVHNPARVLMMN